MKDLRKAIYCIGILLAILTCGQAAPDDANRILARVDAAVNAPRDQSMDMKLILTDKSGAEKVREITMLQKGSDKRMGKFLSPADQKGIGFLSLPAGVMYIYLPAFNKTRRIASHVKNNKFAGTDFTYEDMEAKNYSGSWTPKLLRSEEGKYVLEMVPNNGTETEYSRIVMWVGEQDYYPSKFEYYDKSGKLTKIMTRDKIDKVNGYLTARETEMRDLGSGHATRMVITNIRFDTGIPDDRFTERFLAQ
jgi:outer membrane lipoprotein-sorting protein